MELFGSSEWRRRGRAAWSVVADIAAVADAMAAAPAAAPAAAEPYQRRPYQQQSHQQQRQSRISAMPSLPAAPTHALVLFVTLRRPRPGGLTSPPTLPKILVNTNNNLRNLCYVAQAASWRASSPRATRTMRSEFGVSSSSSAVSICCSQAAGTFSPTAVTTRAATETPLSPLSQRPALLPVRCPCLARSPAGTASSWRQSTWHRTPRAATSSPPSRRCCAPRCRRCRRGK